MQLEILYLAENKNITNASLSLLIKIIGSTKIQTLTIDFTSIENKNDLIAPLAHNVINHEYEKLDLLSK